jgi:hypothetical protein
VVGAAQSKQRPIPEPDQLVFTIKPVAKTEEVHTDEKPSRINFL